MVVAMVGIVGQQAGDGGDGAMVEGSIVLLVAQS